MQKLVLVFAGASMLVLGSMSVANAAAVGGFDKLYDAMITACSLPVGTVEDCEVAINAYSSAVVDAKVDIDTANSSFSEARITVGKINAPNEKFRGDIDALFELLLPDSGAIGVPVSNL